MTLKTKLDLVEDLTHEQSELDGKRERLAKFLRSKEYESLSDAERLRLYRQLSAMNNYSGILSERLGALS